MQKYAVAVLNTFDMTNLVFIVSGESSVGALQEAVWQSRLGDEATEDFRTWLDELPPNVEEAIGALADGEIIASVPLLIK